ncbi:MAG TPA: biotin--[acetyl-CoA-carboxylase] ligase [Chloroflexota bacterium]|nr:biotin--[acetyl-CoA-carboxylase] ligase [Chloroflexota bacterium]
MTSPIPSMQAASPGPLNVDVIRRGVDGLDPAAEIRYSAEVDSTNRILGSLAPDERRHGIILLTDYQSAGRGRRGRRWIAPPRTGLLFSMLLAIPPRALPVDIPVVGALAVQDALTDATGLKTRLKWPNDVLVGDRKLSGILAEYLPGKSPFAVLGIGLNVNFDPAAEPAAGAAATSVSGELGHLVEREFLAVVLFKAIYLWYRCLACDPASVLEAWTARLDLIQRAVRIEDASGQWQGIAERIRRDGGLEVRRTDGVRRTVYAADVSMR